jgi:hypothetical protein
MGYGLLARKTQALSDSEYRGLISRAGGDLRGSVFCWDGEGRPAQLVVHWCVPEQPETSQKLVSLVIGDGCLEKRRHSIEQGAN